jgi:hypothetical protein
MWAVEESRALAVAVDNLPYEEVPAALDAIGIEGAKPDPSIEALPDNIQAVIPPDPRVTTVTPLTASAPSQARAPKGSVIGGQWIETPGGVLSGVQGVVAEQGGASLDPLTGLQPTDGYMVAIQGHNREVPEAEFFGPGGEDALYDWVEENQQVLSLQGSHIGLWHDTENAEVVFDVSQRVDTVEEAITLGGERNQQAIWDVANGEEISTGGTGDRQPDSGLAASAGPAPARGAPAGLLRVGRGPQAGVHPGDDRRAGTGLTFTSPSQARAPKGVPIGGEWIDTPGGLLRDIPVGAVMTLPEGVDLDPILVELGWTMDEDTREVIMPPKDEPDPGPVEHWDPATKYGQPGPARSYEDMANDFDEVNPGNTLVGGDVNCQRVAVAMEMRARGYNVVAPPAPGIDGKVDNIESMWQTPEEGRRMMFSLLPRQTTQDAVLGVDGKPGMRYIVVGYNSDLGSGHAWNAEVLDDGSVFQWDAQSKDEMVPSAWGLDKINVLRVDNMEPTSTMAYDGGRRMPPWAMSQQDFVSAYGWQLGDF